jgi:hypothetical protein
MLWEKNWSILLCNTEESGTQLPSSYKVFKVNITIYIQLCFLDVFLSGKN